MGINSLSGQLWGGRNSGPGVMAVLNLINGNEYIGKVIFTYRLV